MNYLAEIKLFNEWLETNEISTSAIVLWHALMFIAHRSDWRPEMCIPASVLCLRTKLSRSAIYKERAILRDHGLIDFDPGDGRQSSHYRIFGFEERFVSTVVSTTKTQPCTQTENLPEPSTFVSTTRTQMETQNEKPEIVEPEPSTLVSTTRTQPCTQTENLPEPSTLVSTTTTQPCTQTEDLPEPSTFVSTTRTQTWTQNDLNEDDLQDIMLINSDLPNESESCRSLSQSEKDPYISIYINKDIDKGGCGGKNKNDDEVKPNSPKNDAKSPKKKKPEFDLSFIGDEAWAALVSSWLEYKRSRNESYKSDMSVKKFHTMLRNLSRGDPAAARRIIDKSIANNWAGIFELTDSAAKSSGQPATGQRIGQIKQPEDEERRRKLLEKFGGSGNDGKNKT